MGEPTRKFGEMAVVYVVVPAAGSAFEDPAKLLPIIQRFAAENITCAFKCENGLPVKDAQGRYFLEAIGENAIDDGPLVVLDYELDIELDFKGDGTDRREDIKDLDAIFTKFNLKL